MATATEQVNPPVDVEKDVITEDEPTKSSRIPKGISDTLLKHSHDADAAMKAFEGMEGQMVELTEEKSKALLKKIDWHLMPVSTTASSHCSVIDPFSLQIMCIVYGMNYLDKTTLSYASVMGLRLPPSNDKLRSGINLTGDQYQWLGSMFYFGYLAWEYPTTRLLQVLPLGKYCRSLFRKTYRLCTNHC